MFGLGEKRVRRTLENQWLRNFLSKSMVVRWCIALGSLTGLILLVVVNIAPEPLDLTENQISPRTYVARVDFSYMDKNATEEVAARKARLAPNVYRIVQDEYARDILRIEHLFERINELKQSGKISEVRLQNIAAIWNEGAEIQLTASDIQSLFSLPDKKKFVEFLENSSRSMVEAGVVGDDQFSNSDTLIALSSTPENFSDLKTVRASQIAKVSRARKDLAQALSTNFSFPKHCVKPIEKIVTDLINPNLNLDLALSTKFQDKQRLAVGSIYRDIVKGTVLIERGERVTEDKLVLLKKHEDEVSRKESTHQSRSRQRMGMGAVVALIFCASLLLLSTHSKSGPPLSNREYGLLATLVVFQIALCRTVIYTLDQLPSISSLIPAMLPVAAGSMLAGALLQRRFAHVVAFSSSFLLGVITQYNFSVIMTSLISSLAGIHALGSLRLRARIYEAGFLSGISGALVFVVFGFLWDIPPKTLGWQALAAVSSGLVVGFLVSAILPVFELLFKITTDLRWLELADLNHPLLRRMVMEAPGTYHHSLVVANLSERACEAIGAHALQARVCSYFHDVGKLSKPEYFCENQVESESPHSDLTPNMSSLIIIAHVKDGVDLAIQHRLVLPIIDTINQHHGTSQVSYFYRIAKRHEEDARLGSKIMRLKESDVPRVEEETFRYPGPKPQTREIGVISLADAVEGASRSMLKPTPQKIETMISEIIDDRYRDGQLDDCSLSVRDLKIIADSFSKTLLSMMHARVTYPKDETSSDQSPSFPSAAAR
jgi:cyclic-di-AMP phosphodiesterase PgpH